MEFCGVLRSFRGVFARFSRNPQELYHIIYGTSHTSRRHLMHQTSGFPYLASALQTLGKQLIGDGERQQAVQTSLRVFPRVFSRGLRAF